MGGGEDFGFGSRSGSKFKVGSGRVGSDDLGYGPGSGFTLKRVQISTRKHKSMCGGDSGSFWRVNEALYVCIILFTFVSLRIKVLWKVNIRRWTSRLCVPPCPHYITGVDTYSLCVACLGAVCPV